MSNIAKETYLLINAIRSAVIFAIGCIITAPAAGQTSATDYFNQSLTAGFVYEAKAGPYSSPVSPLLNDAPGFRIGYSFRPRHWLALEAGIDQIVRPIGSSVCCEYATNANDQLYLIPFGARYVWDSPNTRLRLTLGGGGAYLNHVVGNGNGGTVGFYGWGGQFVFSGNYAVTRSGRLRAGITARYYFASPRPSENLFGPGFHEPNDVLHILVIGPEVAFSFHRR